MMCPFLLSTVNASKKDSAVFEKTVLKDPGHSPTFSMPSKLLILHGGAKSYCFIKSCAPEGMFNYLS